MMLRLKAGFLMLLTIFLAVACSSAALAPGSAGELEVTGVWGRNSPSAATSGAFYMTISNGTDQDDTLLMVETAVCGTAELHEMYDQGENVMGMRPVPGGVIAVPAGETVELKVGGLHVMCLDKQSAFEVGDEFELILTFERAGPVTVTAEIRDEAPMGMDMGG